MFPVGEAVTELFKLCCRTECTEEIPGRGYAEDEGKGQVPGFTC